MSEVDTAVIDEGALVKVNCLTVNVSYERTANTDRAEVTAVEGWVTLVDKPFGALRISELRRCRTIDLSFGEGYVTSMECTSVVRQLRR